MRTEDLHRHVCSITGKGMSEGFVINHEYIQDEENLVKELRTAIPSFNADINAGYSEPYEGDDSLGGGLIPTTISDEDLKEYSYENDYHYWTEWYDFQDLENEGEGYNDDGILYEFEPLNKVWRIAFDLEDYEIVGGDGVTNELWEHKNTKKLVEIPIEIVRDYANIIYKD